MHPYYQDYRLDEDRMLPIYEELERNDLMVVAHTGYDISFVRDDRADCRRILKVTEMFPRLKFVTTHLGAWQQWDEVEQESGRQTYLYGVVVVTRISYPRTGEANHTCPSRRLCPFRH